MQNTEQGNAERRDPVGDVDVSGSYIFAVLK
jgi:hypothetical protein